MSTVVSVLYAMLCRRKNANHHLHQVVMQVDVAGDFFNVTQEHAYDVGYDYT